MFTQTVRYRFPLSPRKRANPSDKNLSRMRDSPPPPASLSPTLRAFWPRIAPNRKREKSKRISGRLTAEGNNGVIGFHCRAKCPPRRRRGNRSPDDHTTQQKTTKLERSGGKKSTKTRVRRREKEREDEGRNERDSIDSVNPRSLALLSFSKSGP